MSRVTLVVETSPGDDQDHYEQEYSGHMWSRYALRKARHPTQPPDDAKKEESDYPRLLFLLSTFYSTILSNLTPSETLPATPC